MAGKRKTTNLKGPKKLDFKALKAGDVLCPICRTILIEPVTLPCKHAFCNACFKDTMENANLVCPLCRTRVGSWYRRAKKGTHELIDEPFWSAIKDSFPQEVQNKYDGLDSGIEEDKPVIVVSDPGEIRKEYETERKKEEQERKKLKEAEEQASSALIKKIREEEEYRKAAEEEKLRLDAELARKLTKELAASTLKHKRTPKKSFGPLDKFLHSSEMKPSKKPNYSTKECSSGVICLEKFPKNKHNGSKGIVMPVVQKKIQQIHKILETEDTHKQASGSSQASSSLIQLDCRYYFEPIEIFKRSPVDKKIDKKIPVKVPSRRILINGLTNILSPVGKKPKLENRLSAFSRFSVLEGSRSIISEVEEQKTSQKNLANQKTKNKPTNSSFSVCANTEISKDIALIQGENDFSKRSKNNNNLSISSPQRKHCIARRIFQRKNSTLGSGDESPFLGFIKSNKSENLTSNTKTPDYIASSKIEDFVGWHNKPMKRLTADLSSVEVNNKSKRKLDDFSHEDSFTETFIGWPKGKLPEHAAVEPTTPNTKIFHKNNNFKVSTPKSHELNLGWTKHRTPKCVDSTRIESAKPKNSMTFVRNNFSGKSTANSNILNDSLESNSSMTETFLGWSKAKTEKSKSIKSNKNKKYRPERYSRDKNSVSRDSIVDLTVSSDGDALEQSMNLPFLGFEQNTNGVTNQSFKADVDTSITESFHGFDNTKRTRSCSSFTGFHNTEPDVSPEIGSSQTRQKRQPVKRNGLMKHAINGLTPEKKRKLQEAEENQRERELQEKADFELAKKLQSEFDVIATPKRTRRGTHRQVTLDEMLVA